MNWIKRLSVAQVLIGLLWIMLTSMLLSAEAVISIAMSLIFLLGLYQAFKNQRIKMSLIFVLPMVFFFMTFMPPFPENEWSYLWKRALLKLPFLILPFAFAQFSYWSVKERSLFVKGTLLIVSLISTAVAVNYVINIEDIHNQMRVGKAIPTPSNHIRFSLSLAISILMAIAWQYKEKVKSIFWKTITLVLFLILHLLAVRSGLLAFYGGLSVLIIYEVWRTKKWGIGLVMLFAIALVPIVAVKTVPSLKHKMDYLIADWIETKKGEGAGYSDGDRFISWEVGYAIFKDHPLMGVGVGNLKEKLVLYYGQLFPERDEIKKPHSQWVLELAVHGLVGFVIFFFTYVKMWVSEGKNAWWSAICMVFFLSFFVENTLETNFGISVFLTFYLVSLLGIYRKVERD